MAISIVRNRPEAIGWNDSARPRKPSSLRFLFTVLPLTDQANDGSNLLTAPNELKAMRALSALRRATVKVTQTTGTITPKTPRTLIHAIHFKPSWARVNARAQSALPLAATT